MLLVHDRDKINVYTTNLYNDKNVKILSLNHTYDQKIIYSFSLYLNNIFMIRKIYDEKY